ncbi:secreted protein, putative, partial [Ixodes scapularis]
FYQLAERAKLFVAYSEGSDITVFAPTNDALDKYRENNRNKDVQVTYHVGECTLSSNHCGTMDRCWSRGAHVYDTRNYRFFFVNNAKVIRRRDLSHNGLKQKLYVIDDVLEAFIPTSGVTPSALEFLNQPSIYNLNQRLVKYQHEILMRGNDQLLILNPIRHINYSCRVQRQLRFSLQVVRGHVIKDRRLFMRTMSNETYQSAAWEDNIRVELSLANQ